MQIKAQWERDAQHTIQYNKKTSKKRRRKKKKEKEYIRKEKKIRDCILEK